MPMFVVCLFSSSSFVVSILSIISNEKVDSVDIQIAQKTHTTLGSSRLIEFLRCRLGSRVLIEL
jgi:hypothetical protein